MRRTPLCTNACLVLCHLVLTAHNRDHSLTFSIHHSHLADRRPKDGYYFDPVNPLLGDVTEPAELGRFREAIFSFDLPSFADESEEELAQRAQELHAGDHCVVFNLCCHILAAGQLLRGYENFMVDLMTDEKMVKALLDDLMQLKRDFGNDITFWGGGMDTQNVLNKRTPSEVKDSVRRNVDILAPGGGFIFCQVHNIQPDVPPENVIAMFDALDEYGVR